MEVFKEFDPPPADSRCVYLKDCCLPSWTTSAVTQHPENTIASTLGQAPPGLSQFDPFSRSGSYQACGRLSASRATILSGTKLASQNRSDHGGRKRARNHSAAEIVRICVSPLAAGNF